MSICKPKDHSSEVYAHIRSFITRELDTAPGDQVLEAVKENSTQLKFLNTTGEGFSQLNKEISDQAERTADLVADRLKNDPGQLSSMIPEYPKGLVDDQIQKDLSIMRRAHFFQGAPRTDINSSSARSAAFLIVTNHKDASAAVEWLSSIRAVLSMVNRTKTPSKAS